MLTQTVETYLAARRAVGFKLKGVEGYLRDFADFAGARGNHHIVAQTAIDWAAQSDSPAQRHLRLQVVNQLACFSRAEDSRHEDCAGEVLLSASSTPDALHLQHTGDPGGRFAGGQTRSTRFVAARHLYHLDSAPCRDRAANIRSNRASSR